MKIPYKSVKILKVNRISSNHLQLDKKMYMIKHHCRVNLDTLMDSELHLPWNKYYFSRMIFHPVSLLWAFMGMIFGLVVGGLFLWILDRIFIDIGILLNVNISYYIHITLIIFFAPATIYIMRKDHIINYEMCKYVQKERKSIEKFYCLPSKIFNLIMFTLKIESMKGEADLPVLPEQYISKVNQAIPTDL